MGLALAASMASASNTVHGIRQHLSQKLSTTRKPVCGAARVVDINVLSRPWQADMVYVGHGPTFCSPILASPWGNPLLSSDDEYSKDDGFVEYLWDRADIEWLLSPLVGKTLV